MTHASTTSLHPRLGQLAAGARLAALSVAFALAATVTVACWQKKTWPPTVDAAFRAVKAAVDRDQLRALYQLLDQETQWSIISALHDQRELRRIVKETYPAERQGRELARTQAAVEADGPAEFFETHARAAGLVQRLRKLGALDQKEEHGAEITVTSGGRRIRFCRDTSGVALCEFRSEFDALKVRATRDLATIREGLARSRN